MNKRPINRFLAEKEYFFEEFGSFYSCYPVDVRLCEKRIPIVAKFPIIKKADGLKVELSEDVKEAFESVHSRMELYMKEKDAQVNKKLKRIPENSVGNIEHSRRIRNSFK